MKFDTSIQTACYLFGCTRHNYAEYQGSFNVGKEQGLPIGGPILIN